MLRDSFFKKRSVQKRKNGAASPVPSIWPGISSPHGNGVTGKARHLAVSAVHEKGEPRKGRPIGHKKRERLHLSKPHPAENIVFVRIHTVLRHAGHTFGVRAFQNGCA